MSYARKRKLVPTELKIDSVQEAINFLELQTMYERAILKGFPDQAAGLEALSEMMNSKILTLPDENVPLYFFPSIKMNLVNGEAKRIAEEVNTLSLDVLPVFKKTDTMDQTKTPLRMRKETFIEFATTVTIFGILKMTRLTIPITQNSNMSQGEQLRMK